MEEQKCDKCPRRFTPKSPDEGGLCPECWREIEQNDKY